MSPRKGRQEPDLPLFDFPLDGPSRPEAPGTAREGAHQPADHTSSGSSSGAPSATKPVSPDSPAPSASTPLPPIPEKHLEPTRQAIQPSLFDLTPEPKPPVVAPVLAPITSGTAPETTVDSPDPLTDEAPSAPIRARLIAGLIDFAVHLAMVGAMIGCAAFMNIRVGWHSWPSFALLIAAFSFLYWVIPLAFWGRTPGMAWIGISSRALDDEPLSFAQTALRWLGALLTVMLAGLPLALAITGSSLSDRLSQSKTLLT